MRKLCNAFAVMLVVCLLPCTVLGATVEEAKLAVKNGDYEKGMNILRSLSDDNVEAMTLLGERCLFLGANKKYLVEGVTLIRRGAERGGARAQFVLAGLYGKGKGVDKDMTAAFAWCKKSAENGFPTAQYKLSEHYYKGIGTAADKKQALKWLTRSAELEEPNAMAGLGYYYVFGTDLVAKDPKKGVELVRKAAEKGVVGSMNLLAYCYDSGTGVEVNHEKAAKYLFKSADRDNAAGQFRLGTKFLSGQGVRKNPFRAKFWLKASAKQGYQPAIEMLADIRKSKK